MGASVIISRLGAALSPHTRNLTDEMMRALAERGGVLGLCFYGPFVDTNEPTMERFVEHVTHALELMGEGGVGIGTDFDGVSEGAAMIVREPSRMAPGALQELPPTHARTCGLKAHH